MSHVVVPTERAYLKILAKTLRIDDARELDAAGMSPQKALWRSYKQAASTKTAFIDGEIGAIWGIGGCPLGKVGRPWLLTAPPVEHAKIAFIREGRYEVAEMLTVFNELRGFVDARYYRALRFLQVLGFTLSKEFAYGPHDMMFRMYTMRRN